MQCKHYCFQNIILSLNYHFFHWSLERPLQVSEVRTFREPTGDVTEISQTGCNLSVLLNIFHTHIYLIPILCTIFSISYILILSTAAIKRCSEKFFLSGKFSQTYVLVQLKTMVEFFSVALLLVYMGFINPLMPGCNKRSHILKQSMCDQSMCDLCLSMCDLFVTTRH